MFRFRHIFPFKIRTLFIFVILISIFLLFQNYLIAIYTNQSTQFSWEYYSLVPLIDYSIWILMSPLVFELTMRYSFIKFNKTILFKHFLFSIGFVLIQRILSTVLQSIAFYFVEGIWFNLFEGYMASVLIGGIVLHFVIYWMMIGLFSVFQYQKGLQQKEVELTRLENELNNAQLKALKMQLNPHFLFNTLHTISSLMGKNNQGQKVLSKLGALLRFMLYKNKEHEATLANELEYISNYLYIETIRFQDRLSIDLDISDEALYAKVPTLILQPLIENSLKHGFSNKTDSCKIKIHSSIENDLLVLIVEDDGQGVSDEVLQNLNEGIGLKNVKERLNYMFKDNYSFNINSIKNKEFKVTIKIPYYKGL